ncbi:MAG: DNA-packaging protein [Treponema sp.]|jgi:hypothetical protein|nr:DNA-packaging protein [Treponema sp.]
MAKFKVGQPIKYSQAERLRLLNELENYINAQEYPTMPKFCVAQGISKQRIYEWAADKKLNSEGRKKYPLGEYFTDLIKRMNDKQEGFIEDHAVQGHITPSFAIFKLKQPGIGWTDKTDVGVTGDMKISIGLPPEFIK